MRLLAQKVLPLHSHRGMEQLVARWAHNPKVTGSSPVPATPKPSEIQRVFSFPKTVIEPFKP